MLNSHGFSGRFFKAFNDALALTGVILTKTDGDARGGAALSVRAITGKPIKFLGMVVKEGVVTVNKKKIEKILELNPPRTLR